MISEPFILVKHINGETIQISQQWAIEIKKIIENNYNKITNLLRCDKQKLDKDVTIQLYLKKGQQNYFIVYILEQLSEGCYTICPISFHYKYWSIQGLYKISKQSIQNRVIENELVNKNEQSYKRKQQNVQNTTRLCGSCQTQRDKYFEPKQGSKIYCFNCLNKKFQKERISFIKIDYTKITRLEFDQCLQDNGISLKTYQNKVFQEKKNEEQEIQLKIYPVYCQEE